MTFVLGECFSESMPSALAGSEVSEVRGPSEIQLVVVLF